MCVGFFFSVVVCGGGVVVFGFFFFQHQYYMKGYFQHGFAQDECNCLYISSKRCFGGLDTSKRGIVPVSGNNLVALLGFSCLII